MYFTRAEASDKTEPDPDLRILTTKKSNYGPDSETIMVRWRSGLFVPETAPSTLDKLAAEQKVDTVFLTLLDRFDGEGRNVSHKSGAHTYAPTLFSQEEEASGIKKADLDRAMKRLFKTNRIHLEPYGPASRGTSKLVSGAKP
jgi:RecA-family ATPase